MSGERLTIAEAIATDAVACVLVASSAAALFMAVLTSDAFVRVSAALVALGLLLWASAIHRQRFVRRRIYLMLKRRFARVGYSEEDLVRFSGTTCLRLQNSYLAAQHGAAPKSLRAIWRQAHPLAFFEHADSETEERINFAERGAGLT